MSWVKIVKLSFVQELQLALAAQGLAHLVHRVAPCCVGRRGFTSATRKLKSGSRFCDGAQRDQDDVVAVEEQELALALHHPDHPEAQAVDADLLVDRVDVGEERLRDLGADDGHPRAAAHVGRGQEAAPLHVEVVHGLVGGGGAEELRVLHLARCRT